MGDESPKESTLFSAVRSLGTITAEIEVKIFGKGPEEKAEKETASIEDAITRARNRIMDSVETLRKVNRALGKLDRE